ncbi:MAG TPA: hypothetical protein EYH31_01825, partial [Anaerolineae bacterium]|nr:hypothetical protein [Anaerolineae bacterium]
RIALFFVLIGLLVIVAACTQAQPIAVTPTEAPALTEAPTQAPSPTPIPTPTQVPVQAGPPDFSQFGFPEVLVSQEVKPGEATTIQAGPYTVEVPADAFTESVTFEILSGDPVTFAANTPVDERTILAFAFRVRRADGSLVGKFAKPVMFTATNDEIVAESKYYNVGVDGTFVENPKGMQVKDGELKHPIAGAGAGWAITSPQAATGARPSLEQGRVLLQNRCTVCHSLDRVKRATKTEAEWRSTVQRMVGKGAQLNDEELEAVVTYLTATYGK